MTVFLLLWSFTLFIFNGNQMCVIFFSFWLIDWLIFYCIFYLFIFEMLSPSPVPPLQPPYPITNLGQNQSKNTNCLPSESKAKRQPCRPQPPAWVQASQRAAVASASHSWRSQRPSLESREASSLWLPVIAVLVPVVGIIYTHLFFSLSLSPKWQKWTPEPLLSK